VTGRARRQQRKRARARERVRGSRPWYFDLESYGTFSNAPALPPLSLARLAEISAEIDRMFPRRRMAEPPFVFRVRLFDANDREL